MQKNNFKNFSYLLIMVILTLGLSISFQSLLAAWTAPGSNPPDGNTDEPLNKGSSAQTKGGPLFVNFDNNAVPYGLAVSGKVGIGTAVPSKKLSVESTVSDAIYLKGNTGGSSPYAAAYIIAESNADNRGRGLFMPSTAAEANASWFAGVPYTGGGFQIGNSSVHTTETAFGPYIKSNAKLFITTGGNVGIGTVTPGAKLQVAGSGGQNIDTILSGRLQVGGASDGGVWLDSARTMFMGAMGGGYLGWWGNGAGWNLVMNKATGNVGIGTSSPGYKLDISYNSPGAIDTLIRAKNANSGANSGAGIELDGYYPAAKLRGYTPIAGSYFGGAFDIQVNNDSNTFVTALTITKTGNVGIGTAAPGYKLDVQGAGTAGQVNAAAGLCIAGDCKTAWNQVTGTNYWTASGNNIYNGNTGNVGIGTAAPAAKLHIVQGSVYPSLIPINETAVPPLGLTVQAGPGSTNPQGWVYPYGARLSVNGGNCRNFEVMTTTYPNGQLAVRTVDCSQVWDNWKLVLDSLHNITSSGNLQISGAGPHYINSGNVGIGTAGPGSLLHLYKNVPGTNAEIAIQSGDGTTVQGKWAIYQDQVGGGIRFWNINVPGDSNALTIQKTGNVGIGTVNPGAKLEVAGTVKIADGSQGLNKVLTSDANGLASWQTLSGGGNVVDTLAATLVAGNDAGGKGMVNLGSVGIGVAVPAARLDLGIIPDLSTGLKITTSPSGGSIDGVINTTYPIYVYSQANGVAFKVDGNRDVFVGRDLIVNRDLYINAGGDVAEEFVTDQDYPAGTVLVMADKGYKSARISDQPYDNTVIGVVSDNPAVVMGRVKSEKKAVVALVGVIKVKVAATNGRISKGDSLTTSAVPGYAMKATEGRLGTIIGKALEDLKGERGEIMVLINLR